MSRPDPIEYAERLYDAIRAANFSPMSFLAFGNAVKEGVAMRSMPRIAVEPFMRIVGEMLDLEEEAGGNSIDAAVVRTPAPLVPGPVTPTTGTEDQAATFEPPTEASESVVARSAAIERRRTRRST